MAIIQRTIMKATIVVFKDVPRAEHALRVVITPRLKNVSIFSFLSYPDGAVYQVFRH